MKYKVGDVVLYLGNDCNWRYKIVKLGSPVTLEYGNNLTFEVSMKFLKDSMRHLTKLELALK